MSLAIVSTCMNRNAFLMASLPSWLEMNIPVVVVDWSSTVPLRDMLGKNIDRVTLVEVEGKKHYHNSCSRNLAFRALRKTHPEVTHLLSLDCDVIVKDGKYFTRCADQGGKVFYRGNMEYPYPGVSKMMRCLSTLKRFRTLSNCGLIGSFLAPVDLVEEINGYDERMTGYGFFDSDLYQRFSAIGNATEQKVPRHILYHQPHTGRTLNYAEKKQARAMRNNARIAKARRWDKGFEQARQACRVNGEEDIL